MKALLKNTFLGIIAISTVSCSNFTDGINNDPNNFTDSPADLLIGQANLEVVKLSESQASRVAGIFSDQFTGSDRQYIPLNNYTTTAPDFDDEWDDLYADGLAQAQLAEAKAIEDGNIILAGVSQIVQGLLLGEAAALWGDVPYTEALDYFSFPNPNYDSQASVLSSAQELLTSGISNVGSSTIGDAYGSPVYVSNAATWAEVAHSLKARYFLIAKDYPNALLHARQGISSPDNDLLASHSSETGARNLYYQFVVEQRGGYLTLNESHLRKLLDGTTQRRLATPGDAERAVVYYHSTDNGFEPNTTEDGYFAVDANFPIVSYLETKLIEAEAAQRTNDDALTPFNEVRSELANIYGGAFPPSTSTGNDLLLEILEEKFITLIGSLQVFHDLRRTQNAIQVPIKGTNATKLPQRFLYPQIEINSNSNFPGLVDIFTETPVNQ